MAVVTAFFFFALFFLGNGFECPTLVWSDSFATGTSHWTVEDGETNVRNGTLALSIREVNGTYTTALMHTRGKDAFRYGYFEASLKLPEGMGLQPTLWLVPVRGDLGERIEVLKALGSPSEVFGGLTYGEVAPSAEAFQLYTGGSFSANFHRVAVDWQPEEVRWFVNGTQWLQKQVSPTASGKPFGSDFYIEIRLAVAPGLVSSHTKFPATLEVEYVRAYDRGLPYLKGERLASVGEQTKYSIGNVPEDSSLEWNVKGAIKSEVGRGSALVTWGAGGGQVEVIITSSRACVDGSILVLEVEVVPQYLPSLVYVDFEDSTPLTHPNSVVVPNPDANSSVNPSKNCAWYSTTGKLFESVAVKMSVSLNASEYAAKRQKLFFDVLTTAPPHTTIVAHLVNSAKSVPDSFPAGVHSVYTTATTIQKNWELLGFQLSAVPKAVEDKDVDTILLFFNPTTPSKESFFWDNLQSAAIASDEEDKSVHHGVPIIMFVTTGSLVLIVGCVFLLARYHLHKNKAPAPPVSPGSGNTLEFSISSSLPGAFLRRHRSWDKKRELTEQLARLDSPNSFDGFLSFLV